MKEKLKMEKELNAIYIKLGSPYLFQNQCKIHLPKCCFNYEESTFVLPFLRSGCHSTCKLIAGMKTINCSCFIPHFTLQQPVIHHLNPSHIALHILCDVLWDGYN